MVDVRAGPVEVRKSVPALSGVRAPALLLGRFAAEAKLARLLGRPTPAAEGGRSIAREGGRSPAAEEGGRGMP